MDVPFKYLITLLAASICWSDGFDWYCASKFVTVAISGLVHCDSHCRPPTSCLIWRMVWGEAGVVGGGILSIGYPDLNGVLVGLAESSCAMLANVSMNDVWLRYTERLLFSSLMQSNFMPRKWVILPMKEI